MLLMHRRNCSAVGDSRQVGRLVMLCVMCWCAQSFQLNACYNMANQLISQGSSSHIMATQGPDQVRPEGRTR